MKKMAIMLMVITIVCKVSGFARDLVLSYFYGVSDVSDAYLISLTIPHLLFNLIGNGLATSFIPMYTCVQREQNREFADRFTSSIMNFMLIICTLIVVLCMMFTVPIVKVFAAGFEGETLNLAVSFTRISIVGIYFSGVMHLFSGYLQLKNNFIAPAVIGVPLNLFMIIAIGVSVLLGTTVLAMGTVIAMAIQLLCLWPFVMKEKFNYYLIIDWNENYFKKMLRLSVPVIMSLSINQINILIDRTIASEIATGGISALTYANRLNLFIQAVVVSVIASIVFPAISEMATNRNIKGVKKTLSEAIGGINLLVIPATVGAMVFAEPIVRLLFGRGAFGDHAIGMTADALFYYAIGMTAFGLREVLARVFYSLQDSKTPMTNAVIAVIINIVLIFFLSRYLGVGGLALSTSISAIVCTILLFISLRKKIGPLGIRNLIRSTAKTVIAAVIMATLAKISYGVLQGILTANLALIVSITMGMVVYLAMICVLKIDDAETLVKGIKMKLEKTEKLRRLV